MNVLLLILGSLAALTGIVCWFIILIDAFQDAIWKGLACIFCCGLYMLYYAFFEFEHENKWPILIFAFGGSAISTGIWSMMR